MKVKSRLPTIAAPAPSPPRERTTQTQTRCEAEEEHSKRALNVALATAAAAEAAVAAAHAAAEVVLLTGVNHSACQCDKQLTKVVVQQEKEYQAKRQELAAIVIQSIFRGYLARKALRALKGIVKLQAIIRGRNVRRQAMNTLKCLQSIVSIQSQVSAKRIQGNSCMDQNKEFANVSSDKIIKMDTNSQKRWDGSILTKEEAKALFLSKKEAALKRERIKDYSFNHRFSAETERNKANNGRWRYWLEQWVDTQVTKSKELEDLDTILTSNPKPRLQYTQKKPTIRNAEETESQNLTTPRRSFHRKQSSLGDETSFSKSPTTIPKYMSSTESAKAKARSMSSPKLRPASGFDAYSDSYSPSKNRFITNPDSNPMSVRINGGKGLNYQQQRSPSLKGIAAAVKSNHSTLKDLSFDSDCTFKTWNHQISGNFV